MKNNIVKLLCISRNYEYNGPLLVTICFIINLF